MLPSGPAVIRPKTINNPTPTARASRFCAFPGDSGDRISCASSETRAAVCSIRATPGRLHDTPEAGPSTSLPFHAPSALARLRGRSRSHPTDWVAGGVSSTSYLIEVVTMSYATPMVFVVDDDVSV